MRKLFLSAVIAIILLWVRKWFFLLGRACNEYELQPRDNSGDVTDLPSARFATAVFLSAVLQFKRSSQLKSFLKFY